MPVSTWITLSMAVLTQPSVFCLAPDPSKNNMVSLVMGLGSHLYKVPVGDF